MFCLCSFLFSEAHVYRQSILVEMAFTPIFQAANPLSISSMSCRVLRLRKRVPLHQRIHSTRPADIDFFHRHYVNDFLIVPSGST